MRQAHTYRLCTMILSCLVLVTISSNVVCAQATLNPQDPIQTDAATLQTSGAFITNVQTSSALSFTPETITDLSDTLFIAITDTTPKTYKPDPTKAIWYSALFPGLGQLYNRRYWKLPLVAAGVAGISYAISWNSKYYVAYTNAYRDISDNNPDTKSFLKLLPSGTTNYNESQLKSILKNRQQRYRRSRDLSFIGAVGVYIICILDAYVDAQLYDFDISPDLSIHPAPVSGGLGSAEAFELCVSFRF